MKAVVIDVTKIHVIKIVDSSARALQIVPIIITKVATEL